MSRGLGDVYKRQIYGTEIARGMDVFELVPSEHLTENEIAAARIADQGELFNPQQQFRVTWPAEPVVARAYMDQLNRADALSAAMNDDLSELLVRAEVHLADGDSDRRLARELETVAEAIGDGDGAAPKQRAGLAETLGGIAARLR